MSTNIYQTTLNNSDLSTFSVSMRVSKHTLLCTFLWPTYIQELYDNSTQDLQDMSAADPLVGTDQLVRGYDYLDYYLNMVPQTNIAQWLQEQTVLPQSIRKLASGVQVTKVRERVTLCEGIKAYRDQLAECLHWTMRIQEDADITVVDVIPGGRQVSTSGNWAVCFITDALDEIAKDQLDLVTAEFEVYDD